MAYLTEKNINGRKYLYLVKSIRLPDGSQKKIHKLVKNTRDVKTLENKHRDYFNQKEKKLYTKYALRKYETDPIYTKNEIEKLESIRVDYRNIIRKLSVNQLKDAFDRFSVNFTYESNALEGNSLTLKDVAVVILENTTIEGKTLREIYETRNLGNIMEMLKKDRFNINHKDIIRVHKLLMKDIDTTTGYKKIPNYIIGRRVETTPPEKVEPEMSDLIHWYEKSIEYTHPLNVSAIFHGRFEKIHPFEDGNGRVGRVLSNIILMKNKYPPLIIRKSQRISYLKTLEDYDNGYEWNLKRFFLMKFKDTYKKFFEVYIKYLD
ncbi:MAG: Fic family protein [Candidatus Altiarchaeota archaeon]|nr:Fic family protein [Candidatus Altiarchaeota archaeon]